MASRLQVAELGNVAGSGGREMLALGLGDEDGL